MTPIAAFFPDRCRLPFFSMQFFIALLYITALSFSCALAKDHDVAVGQNAALTFNPSSLTGVQNGDTITFHLCVAWLYTVYIQTDRHCSLSGNHTLTQSTFDEPCKAKCVPPIDHATVIRTDHANREGGVDSGYQDVQNAGGGDRLHYTITVRLNPPPSPRTL